MPRRRACSAIGTSPASAAPTPANGSCPAARAIPKYSLAASAAATARSAASAQSPYQIAPNATGIATSEKRTRRTSSGTLGRDLAEAPLATLVLDDRLVQLAPPEVRPEHGRDVELR